MPQSSTKQFSGIFLCYRRDDSSGHAGRLSDKLSDHFGKDQIFMDIDTIKPGEDFVTVIENAVGSCEILIAIIGRHWLSSAGEAPGWLDNPNDFVRLEIATALSRDIRVIPVLVQRASMPKPQDLPDDLAKFSRRNAVELSDLDWQNDVDQLISFLERILANLEEARRKAAREEEECRQREAELKSEEELRLGHAARQPEKQAAKKHGAGSTQADEAKPKKGLSVSPRQWIYLILVSAAIVTLASGLYVYRQRMNRGAAGNLNSGEVTLEPRRQSEANRNQSTALPQSSPAATIDVKSNNNRATLGSKQTVQGANKTASQDNRSMPQKEADKKIKDILHP